MMKRFSRSLAAAVVAASAFFSTGAQALVINQMFVFGDSGSDPGNAAALTQVAPGVSFFPPSQPSGVPSPAGVPYDYRFSNGPVVPEYLAGLLGIAPSLPAWPAAPANPNTNFAVGGAMTGAGPVAGIPAGFQGLCCNYNFLVDSPGGLQTLFPDVQFTGLNNQVALFASRLGSSIPLFDPQTTLFYVQGGYNDVFLALALASTPGLTGAEQAAILQGYTINAAMNMGMRIGELALLNAEQFLVVNMFDLGRMPFVIDAGIGSVVTPLTLLYNSVLHSIVAQLEADLGLDIIEYDAFAALEDTIASGAFTNTTQTCFDAADLNGSLARIYGGCQGYLFFDGAHPTTAVALRGAGEIALLLVPEPPGAALIALGLLAIVWMRRRSSAMRVFSLPNSSPSFGSASRMKLGAWRDCVGGFQFSRLSAMPSMAAGCIQRSKSSAER